MAIAIAFGQCLAAVVLAALNSAIVLSQDLPQLTLRDVVAALHQARRERPLELNNFNASGYDLSGVDFKSARMANANFFGSNLSNADLGGADLSGATLNRAVVIRTNFANANLSGTSIMRPTVFSDLSLNRTEAPDFEGANLSNARITGNLDGANFQDAILAGVNFEPHEPRADISFFPRNFCRGCDFSGASLKKANLYDASFVMAKFVNADLSGANLARTDLSYTDLTGANLAGANLTGANLDSAVLVNVRGLESVVGLSSSASGDGSAP